MSNELAEDVKAFFRAYCAAFETLDVEAIADCVAYPSDIVSDGEDVVLIAIANRQECLATMNGVVELHRQLGAPSGRIHDLSITELSPRLAQASLTMEALDRASNHLYDFQATYSLARLSGEWRITRTTRSHGCCDASRNGNPGSRANSVPMESERDSSFLF